MPATSRSQEPLVVRSLVAFGGARRFDNVKYVFARSPECPVSEFSAETQLPRAATVGGDDMEEALMA